MQPMSEDAFWAIIAASRAQGQDQQADLLRSALEQLSPDELAAFQLRFDDRHQLAYTWDLWGAAYVIEGGCSDDGFTDFRYALIAAGRDVYDAALRDAETLADLAEAPTGFEEFGYVAGEVWEAKTGGSREMPRPPISADDPTGEPFDEDEQALAARYPRLWAKYGDA